MGTLLNRVVGGATAEGLSDNIRAGYSFIANNYHTGDEIFIFGFSRGGTWTIICSWKMLTVLQHLRLEV